MTLYTQMASTPRQFGQLCAVERHDVQKKIHTLSSQLTVQRVGETWAIPKSRFFKIRGHYLEVGRGFLPWYVYL